MLCHCCEFKRVSNALSNELLRIRDEYQGTGGYVKWTQTGRRSISKLRKMFQPIFPRWGRNDYGGDLNAIWAVADDICLGIHWRGRTPSEKELCEALEMCKSQKETPWFTFDQKAYKNRWKGLDVYDFDF